MKRMRKAKDTLKSESLLLVSILVICILISFESKGDFVAPEDINLVDAPLDSVQQTLWFGFPVVIHRRTKEQLKYIESSFESTPAEFLRFLSYQSIARSHSHEFASAVMEFTENYIATKNVYMSELSDFGIYSQVSPVFGCAVAKIDTGFIDPCNNVEFDFAGRVKEKSGAAHLRLMILPHRVVDNKLEFIEDYKPQKVTDFTPDILKMDITDIEKALLAIDFERLDILKQISKQNPIVITQQNSAGTNLVQMAAYYDTTLDYLLSFENIKIDHINNAGYTALMFAVWNENFENAEKIINYGATPQGYFYENSYVPSIYEFMVNEYRFTEAVAKEVYEQLLEIEKVALAR